jgi:hypothetical protein
MKWGIVVLFLAAAIHPAWARTVWVGIPGHNITQAAFYVVKERGWYRDELATGCDLEFVIASCCVRRNIVRLHIPICVQPGI